MKRHAISSTSIGPALCSVARQRIRAIAGDHDLLESLALTAVEKAQLERELSAIVLFAIIGAVMQCPHLRKVGGILLDDMHLQLYESITRSGEMSPQALEEYRGFLQSRYKQYSAALGDAITTTGMMDFTVAAHSNLQGRPTDSFFEAFPVFVQIFRPTFDSVLETLLETGLVDEPRPRWVVQRQPDGTAAIGLTARRKTFLQRLREAFSLK